MKSVGASNPRFSVVPKTWRVCRSAYKLNWAGRIFDPHRALLNDGQFRERICGYIDQQQVNAECAVETAVKDIAASLESADNEYLRERAADVRDLGRRILRHLSDDERRPLAYLPVASIVVARVLFPLDLIEIDRTHLAAIATERGGATGHAAILASVGDPSHHRRRRCGAGRAIFSPDLRAILRRWIPEIARYSFREVRMGRIWRRERQRQLSQTPVPNNSSNYGLMRVSRGLPRG